jgi:hypothetical protein
MESTTIDTINRLANRRQALWLQAGKPGGGLGSMEKSELEHITATLPQLWHQRRCELVGSLILL